MPAPSSRPLSRGLVGALAATLAFLTLTGPAQAEPSAYELPIEWAGYPSVGSGDRLSKVSETGLLSMPSGPSGSRLKGTWGVYGGPGEESWAPYVNATGKTKTQLGHIALNPKARWFGRWSPDSQIADTLARYIAESQHGDPDAWVQLTIFRMDPWYYEGQRKVPTKSQIASYKTWIRNSAAAIGNTKAIIFLQPDATLSATTPRPALSARLIRFAAKIYGALPRTRLYLETGGWDWPHPAQGGAKKAARLLAAQGMQYADGVVTNTTHYNATEWDIERVAAIAKIFARQGQKIRGVINTSTSGNGLEFGKVGGRSRDHVKACRTRALRGKCVTLGIPPTTDVANPAWGLSAKHRRLAARYVDAYAWVGRPWLQHQNYPWLQARAKTLVKSSPFYLGPS